MKGSVKEKGSKPKPVGLFKLVSQAMSRVTGTFFSLDSILNLARFKKNFS